MFVFLFILFLILTAASLSMIAVFICVGIPYVNSDRMLLGLFIWLIAFLAFAIIGCFAYYLHLYLKKESEKKAMRVVLTILSLLTIIQYGIGGFLVRLIIELKEPDPNPIKKIETKDENGNKHTITQTYTGSSRFKDENGDYWSSSDGGETYHRD